MNQSETVLEIKDLCVEFQTVEGKVQAVDHLSYTLHKSEKLGIVGESGSGKSVSSLAMMQLIPNPPGRVTGGEILYKGKDLVKLSEKELCRIRGNEISMIFQEPMTSLNPVLTIGRQVEEALKIHGETDREKRRSLALEALSEAGLGDPEGIYGKYPHQLSGGMRQRVMIAAALVTEPELLIADEPTTALDVTVQAQILELLKEINRRHKTAVLFISHDLAVIRRLCGRVLVMNQGIIEEEGEVSRVFEHPQQEYTRKLLAAIPDRRTSLRKRRRVDQ